MRFEVYLKRARGIVPFVLGIGLPCSNINVPIFGKVSDW